MVYRYPPEVHELVKQWAPELRDRELAEKCNRELGTSFTKDTMKCFRYNHGYLNSKKQWTSEEYWKYQTKWPHGMFEFIRDNSWGKSSKEMAEIVNEKFGTNFTQQRMKVFRAKHKIRSGVTGWYQKGHAPGNKGKKLEEYVKDPKRVAEIRQRCSPTWFKEGKSPPNELPLGTIVIQDKTDSHRRNTYKLIKVNMEGDQWTRWKLLHRYVWEQHNGPIPDGMVITFKDGDPMNCDIGNLMMVSKGEMIMMIRKGYISEDPELTETALNLVRLQQTAKSKEKHGKDNNGRKGEEAACRN